MVYLRGLALAAALALPLAACGAGEEPQREAEPPAPEQPAPDEGDGIGALELDAETLVGGLEVPWGIAFLPDGGLLVTERPGRVRVVSNGELAPEPVAELDVAAQGEAGLLGIALHPEYPDEPFVYLYYTHPAGENRIVRMGVSDGGPAGLELGREEVLLEGIPAATIHDGGRLAFGRDGLLYATTGDAGEPARSADPESLGGKILRLAPDGSVPDGNPFGSPVYSYGHRNPQGIAWDADGALYASDHGPSGEFGLCCHDELTRVEEGGFHGWPLRAGETDAASPGDVGLDGPPDEPVDPIAASGGEQTWAPGGIALHEPEGERTSVLVAELAGERLARHVLSPDGTEVAEEETALDDVGRLRDVAAGPDGCFYALTSNRDGRGSPGEGDDRILRLCPR